jgi:hypothetical protein
MLFMRGITFFYFSSIIKGIGSPHEYFFKVFKIKSVPGTYFPAEFLLEEFLKLVSIFKEASQDFIFHFLHNKASKKFKNHLHIYKKY